MKSLFLLLFFCTLYLPVNARSLSQPPKGPGDPGPVCLFWNGKKESPPEEMVVNFQTQFCAVILKKDNSGEWQLARLDITKKFGAVSTNSVCFLIGNTYNYVCVGDRCSTTGPLKESAKGSDYERKEKECLKEIKDALDKSLPLVYPTAPSPIARSLYCLDGSPPYARQLSEGHSHCVAHFALDPVGKTCEVTKYSTLKEPNLNLRNNTCISEDGHAVCYCDSPKCNWELEKFHPALNSLGQSLGSGALSTCKPKPQCAVLEGNVKAVKFEDRKESQFCYTEYLAGGTVKRMGSQEPQEKTPTLVDRMCQVRDRNGFICFCKSHKCVAEFVPNNTPMYDGNWQLVTRTEKYATKLRVRHCGNPTVWTHDPGEKQICTKVFAQNGQACSVSYEFIGKRKGPQCVVGKGEVQCICKTEKCHNEELKEHLRDLNKQIDPSREDCLIVSDIEQRTTAQTTARPQPFPVPGITDVPVEVDVGTSTVKVREHSTTRQEKEKATTTATASASTTQGQTADGKSSASSPVHQTTRASNPEGETNANSKGHGGKAEGEKKKEAGGFPNWAIYLIVGLVQLVILIHTYIIVVVLKWRREKREEAERERIRLSMPWNQEIVKKTSNEPERADDPKSPAIERTQPSERVGGDVSGPKKEAKKKQEEGGKAKEVSKKDGKEPRKEGGADYKTPEEMV